MPLRQPSSQISTPGPVEANIRSVATLEQTFEERKRWVDRVADAIGGFSGSMTFVGLHLTWFVTWFLINTGHVPGVRKFDPFPFILLSMMVSVEAVLLSTFVLMKQNQMQRRTDHRDQLNLQIDLLSEKEITKVLQVLRSICRKLEIHEPEFDAELREMSEITSVDNLAQQIQSSIPPKG